MLGEGTLIANDLGEVLQKRAEGREEGEGVRLVYVPESTLCPTLFKYIRSGATVKQIAVV